MYTSNSIDTRRDSHFTSLIKRNGSLRNIFIKNEEKYNLSYLEHERICIRIEPYSFNKDNNKYISYPSNSFFYVPVLFNMETYNTLTFEDESILRFVLQMVKYYIDNINITQISTRYGNKDPRINLFKYLNTKSNKKIKSTFYIMYDHLIVNKKDLRSISHSDYAVSNYQHFFNTFLTLLFKTFFNFSFVTKTEIYQNKNYELKDINRFDE